MVRFPTRPALAVLVALSVFTAVRTSAAPLESPMVFEAPSASRPAGNGSGQDPFGGILPSGRLLHPTGSSVVVGTNALGVALSPRGDFAIVSNADERQGDAGSATSYGPTGGYSLAVVDVRTMTVVSRYQAPGETYFCGVAALRDPANPANVLVLASGGATGAVYAFDLDAAGQLLPDAQHAIALPGPVDPNGANAGRAFPATIVLSPSGRRAYVVDNLGNQVDQLDTATRTIAGSPVPVGYFPLGAAFSQAGLLVANEGLMNYEKLDAPAAVPPFGAPPPDLARASSLSVVQNSPDESLSTSVRAYVPLDRAPDGFLAVGGAHPAAVAALRDKPFAFVAMAGVDRVATISLAGLEPRAVGGTELRLYDRGPYGTQPVALALSRDGRRLYVALAGIDAIAVLDTTSPQSPHRIGLIPTGWYPSALALSRDGGWLYVANAKGAGAGWSTLERIDLRHVDLRRTTPLALSYLRSVARARPNVVVPQLFGTSGSAAIKHVVVIVEPGATFDATLGDIDATPATRVAVGDPSLATFGETVTPNLHALARTFAFAANLYADAPEAAAGQQFVAGGIASDYTERTLLVQRGRGPLADFNQDPEDYPRAGYLFNAVAAHGLEYRDYGGLLDVSGYAENLDLDPSATGPTLGLGGRYSLDVPAPVALGGHVDLNYPGENPRIRDLRRAQEFVRDYGALEDAGRVPALTYLWLPGGLGTTPPNLAPAETAADDDRALGQIVEYLTHVPEWSSTAIFILPASAGDGRDHVDPQRAYAIVVSPYTRRGFVDLRHLSTVSALKTEEEILGLPALSLGDALATDMHDMFTAAPDLTPFAHVDDSAHG
jgi:DNA-binding beta-propeller fold protein YncE